MAASSDNLITMKLVVDPKSRRVLFAEASSDVVNFLLSILSLPVGAIIKRVSADGMVGSIGSLYQSLEDMNDTYMCSHQTKASLLDPVVVSSESHPNVLMLPAAPPGPPPRTSYYTCYDSHSNAYGYNCGRRYYTDVSGTRCPNCKDQMSTLMHHAEPPDAAMATVNGGDGGAGYVRGPVTYTVMDDLTVTPASSVSAVTILSKFSINDVSALQEKTVEIDLEKGLEMLRCSLQSKTVLTDVFLAVKEE